MEIKNYNRLNGKDSFIDILKNEPEGSTKWGLLKR